MSLIHSLKKPEPPNPRRREQRTESPSSRVTSRGRRPPAAAQAPGSGDTHLTPTVPALRQPREPRNKLPVKLKRPARSVCAQGPGSGRGTRPAAHPPPQASAELRTWSGPPRTRVAAAAELQQARPRPTARQPPAPAPPPQTCASDVFARVREMRPGGVSGPERGASGRPGRCGRAHRFGEPSVSADPAPSRFPALSRAAPAGRKRRTSAHYPSRVGSAAPGGCAARGGARVPAASAAPPPGLLVPALSDHTDFPRGSARAPVPGFLRVRAGGH